MTPDELDRWAAEKVMGWEQVFDKDGIPFWKFPSGRWDWVNWHPLTDLNQTFMCVEKLYETKKWLLSLTKLDNGNWEAYFADWTKEYRCYESGDEIVGKVIEDPNPARAILLAAHKALEGN